MRVEIMIDKEQRINQELLEAFESELCAPSIQKHLSECAKAAPKASN